MTDDLKIVINVKQDDGGKSVDVNVIKPPGMPMAEVIGYIEYAKFDLIAAGAVNEVKLLE